MIFRILLLVCIGLTLSCSTRVEYERTVAVEAPGAININTATMGELERLPGVGRGTAEAIIEYRNENGPFRRTEHLMQIRGISDSRFQKMREFIKAE
ncbi:MAG: helix-hairpin-helix domain-containing protein [Pyrinomonadaceae bacterium]|nr:helix-hairpin-helix domain-containing protein [Pyrinomonadaceae bacterium]